MKNAKSEFTNRLHQAYQTRSSHAIDAVDSQVSERQIFAALGFIVSLLLIGGIQLYRCVNSNSTKIKAIAPQQTLRFDLEDSSSIAPSVELKSFAESQKTEMLTIQNAISNGKF